MMQRNPYRLLTIVSLFAIAQMAASTEFAQAQHFESLFNGRDLQGWDGDPSIWSVEEGTLTGQTTAEAPIEHNAFIIWQGKPLRNFRLELQYRLTNGNSGIQYRSQLFDPKKRIISGYQADMVAGPEYSGILYDERGRGILALRGERTLISADGQKKSTTFADASELQKLIRPNDWNDYLIEAEGNVLKHSINGHLMSETHDAETAKRDAEGLLALQVHRGPPMKVQFRAIRLKRLAD